MHHTFHYNGIKMLMSPRGGLPFYFTGIMMCSYGVPPHIINGLAGLLGDRGITSSIPAIPTTMTCGPVVTHFAPAGGLVANGSSLLASDPPCSM